MSNDVSKMLVMYIDNVVKLHKPTTKTEAHRIFFLKWVIYPC
jgi:hypothetical protein